MAFPFCNFKGTELSPAPMLFHFRFSSAWDVLFLILILGGFLSGFESQLNCCLLQEAFPVQSKGNLRRIIFLFISFLPLVPFGKHHVYLFIHPQYNSIFPIIPQLPSYINWNADFKQKRLLKDRVTA